MSNKGKKDMASAAAQAAAQAAALAAAGIGNSSATSGQYDPATLLALYSMSNAYGSAFATGASSSQPSSSPSSSGKATPTSTATSAQGFGGLGALAAAAGIVGGAGGAGVSGGASVSSASANNSAQQQANQQWWAMAASQYAAQEYMARIQAATRDPAAYAVLAAQGVVPNYQMLSQGSKSSGSGRKSTQSPSLSSLKLPSDTEIIKYTSSVTGSKDPGSSNRGRKKTISLDSNLTTSDYAALAANISGSSNDITPPIPAGLTIERKKKNSGSNERSSPMVDRVEITKIPVSNGTSSPVPPASSNFKSSTPKAGTAVDSPLNLSMKSPMGSGSADNSGIYTSKSIGGSKIPQEYYACKC